MNYLALRKSTASIMQRQSIHTSSVTFSQRRREHDALVRQLGPKFNDQIINVKQMVDNLKILQAERTLKNHPDSESDSQVRYYNRAQLTRQQMVPLFKRGCVLPAFPPATYPSREVSLDKVRGVLSDENSVAWRLISGMVTSGRVKEIDALSEEMRAAILFHTVHGIGQVKAKELAAEGFRSLDELKDIPHRLDKSQKLGLQHYEDMQSLIPREEIDEFKQLFSEALKIDPEIKFEICGSYRRGNALCSDIDIVAWHKQVAERSTLINPIFTLMLTSYNDRKSKSSETGALMELVWVALRNAGLAYEDKALGKGPKKISALIKLPKDGSKWRQVDIRLSTLDSLPYTMLAMSGDDTLQKILRKQAKEGFNLTLNEYEMGQRKTDSVSASLGSTQRVNTDRPRLFAAIALAQQITSTQAVEGTQILVKDERGIFEHLKIPYLEPEQRNYRTYQHIIPRHFF
ncbi:hypothetical protein HD553DRAFT_333676 [Filobasidium floriforme]|uniref:uncharacterized protein n=1 Tax=Filobasidium floriforme TaxID=5210 RepID=UPI001E8DE70E|nr:uncharacterized protein HD553DRAFT_333676 [Filobasidium floriforme]KAH8089082.1 hypothetical protein HD553DRAFT_333676 [Filobasidium floriforme]